ncbi:MAG: hypothetical protein QM756_06905 [Polyangiaceae bacterium]
MHGRELLIGLNAPGLLLAALFLSVACGSDKGKSPSASSGGAADSAGFGGSGGGARGGGSGDTGGDAGATGVSGSGGGGSVRDRFGARLVAGGVIMTSNNFRVVGAMTTGSADKSAAASKNYELQGGALRTRP